MIFISGNVIQYNEYYPFGLQTANSWTREKAVGNNFLANGGTELNTTTALYDLDYRTYDPALGRMYQVDPMSGKYSSLTTYNYAFNNPASFNDPNGADPEEAAQFKAQKALGSPSGVSNSFDNLYRGNSMFSMFDTGWRPGIGSMAATISQWNPNFGGPMYLGQGYNGAIYGLPTEIEAAGGADEFIESKGGLDPTYGYNEKSLNRMRMEYNRTIRAPGSSFEDWLEERQSQEGSLILDIHGNIIRSAQGANLIYIDTGNGLVLFDHELILDGTMTPKAFSNALLSVVNGMKLPKGTFDKNRLHNGEISLAITGNDDKVISYNGGRQAGAQAHYMDGKNGTYMITYQHFDTLTVSVIQSLIGVHEYYAHGVEKLRHWRLGDEEKINELVNCYPYK